MYRFRLQINPYFASVVCGFRAMAQSGSQLDKTGTSTCHTTD